MVRNIRTAPRGLVAPLSQTALAALRALHETNREIPQEHRCRLLDLGLIETATDGMKVTAIGRERLVSDR
ncbi:hypothetical protein [Reyranella sp.]|uniref:hypothetical protein n=1 Tax=Reyranella sp. TaxID=1929291 RepID=UPI003BA85ADE